MYIHYWASNAGRKVFKLSFIVSSQWLEPSDCHWLVPGTQKEED